MFHVSSHADGFGSFLFVGSAVYLRSAVQGVQPVLPGDVVRFLFFCVEGGGLQGQTALFVQPVGGVGGSEQGAEQIFLLSFKIDFKLTYIVESAEAGVAVFRLEVIAVF